jgi:hypothetical protein
MNTLHNHINAKATGLKRAEREKGSPLTLIERQRILCEWYGVYFRF